MAYRSGTYVAFHAGGTTDPTAPNSDIKYYNLLKGWNASSRHEFRLTDSHEKTSAVRDTSLKATLAARLRERLNNSKNMLLIITRNTIKDRDWVPYEITYAVDTCGIPIIAAYPDFDIIRKPADLWGLWPICLKDRINNNTASVIHIPYRQTVINNAINQFDPSNRPLGNGLGYYSNEAYRSFGLL